MTVDQARLLLGRAGRGLSAAQVEERIAAARELATILWSAWVEGKIGR